MPVYYANPKAGGILDPLTTAEIAQVLKSKCVGHWPVLAGIYPEQKIQKIRTIDAEESPVYPVRTIHLSEDRTTISVEKFLEQLSVLRPDTLLSCRPSYLEIAGIMVGHSYAVLMTARALTQDHVLESIAPAADVPPTGCTPAPKSAGCRWNTWI